MIMADVLKIALLITGFQAVMVSFWLLARALMPARVEAAEVSYGERPWRITLSGLVAAGLPLALGLLLLEGGAVAKFVGFLLASAALVAGLLGSAGLAQKVGRGLGRPIEDEREPWRPVLRGGIVLVFALLLPFVGWFILLPATLASGAGALLARRGAGATAVAETTSASEMAAGAA